MAVSAMNDREESDQQAEARFTIRFPQIDAAGIAFYPRYFEMVGQCFPNLRMDEPPYEIDTRFLSPITLGSQLVLKGTKNPAGWAVSAWNGREECFTMRSKLVASDETVGDELPDNAFETGPLPVTDWCAGTDGKLLLSRSFEFLNVAIEEWFEDTLALPFHALHVGRRTGIPTVQFVTHARKLPEVGSEFSIRIRPTRVGSRAMSFTSWLVSGHEWLIRNEQTVVFVSMLKDGFETMTIPDDVRLSFAEQLGSAG
jgi:acyl-CoA thioesterase FadM